MKIKIKITTKILLCVLLFCSSTLLAKQVSNVDNTIKTITSSVSQEIKKEEIKVDLSNLDSTSNSTQQEANIYLNIKDTSLKNIVNYLADQKNINLIPHKDLENLKVSMSTRTPLTLDQAWQVLLTLLETNNFSLINVDDVYRIVPNAQSKQQPLPSYIDLDPENLPSSDIMIRYIYLFKNIKGEDVKPILDAMLTPNSVLLNPNLNSCLITEKSLNIKTAMKIIKELDTSGLRESIQVLQLNHTNAEDVAKLFNEQIIGAQQGPAPRIRTLASLTQEDKRTSYFSKATRIISDPRTNRLILLGTQTNLKRVKNFIEKYIDKPLASETSRIHIKELKYVDAETIQPLVEKIINPPIQKGKTLIGQTKYFEDIVIAAESSAEQEGKKSINVGAGNRLLIACNKEDWKRIDYFIDKLDKPQPQVAIEILFVDVQRDGKRELGAQLRNKKINTLGNHNDIETQQIVASATHIAPLRSMIDVVIPEDPPKDYPSFMTIGNSDNIWAVARSVLKTENINVISQPYVIAGNNKESIIEVSDKRNIDGEIEYTTVLPIQKKIDVEAKVEAKITPVINKEGTINLVIFISINEFTGTDNNNRTNRLIQTRTTMTDGEVLVIGGLTQDTKTDSIYKTPILGDIPIIGNFFKGRTKSSVKKDLFVFIRPSLVKPRFEGKPEEYTQLKLDYAKQRVGINTTFLTSKDPIQRWFFMPPSKGKIKTLEDLEKEDVKSIIDFTQGKDIPRSVIPSVDPYYTPEEAPELQRYSERSMSRRKAKQLEKKRKLMEKREKKKQIKLSKRKRRSRLA